MVRERMQLGYKSPIQFVINKITFNHRLWILLQTVERSLSILKWFYVL